MNKIAICYLLIAICVCGCAAYTSPPRDQWSSYLRGSSMMEMTDSAKVAKRPMFIGSGGKIIGAGARGNAPEKNYGTEPQPTDINPIVFNYMANLEHKLYDSLLKPGIQVQRVGTDVVLLLVRDSFMDLDRAEISDDGAGTLKIVAKILKKYDATFMEISGYTDSMRDQTAAGAMSLDMAQRVAIFMAKNEIAPVRMFIVGRGSARPIAAQDDMGRLTNRRVEIRISPAR